MEKEGISGHKKASKAVTQCFLCQNRFILTVLFYGMRHCRKYHFPCCQEQQAAEVDPLLPGSASDCGWMQFLMQVTHITWSKAGP